MLVIDYTLSPGEFKEYSYYSVWSAPHRIPFRKRYYYRLIALYVMVAAIYMLANKHHNLWIDAAVFFGIGIIYFLLIPKIVGWYIYREARSILKTPAGKQLLEPATLKINETGILDKDASREMFFNWDQIKRKSETKNMIFLYTDDRFTVVIPKKALKNAIQQEQLKTYLEQYLPLEADLVTKS